MAIDGAELEERMASRQSRDAVESPFSGPGDAITLLHQRSCFRFAIACDLELPPRSWQNSEKQDFRDALQMRHFVQIFAI